MKIVVKNKNYVRKSTSSLKVKISLKKIEMLGKRLTVGLQSEFQYKIYNFGQKSKFRSKIKILAKNWNFGQKSKFCSKNQNFGQKWKFCSKVEIIVWVWYSFISFLKLLKIPNSIYFFNPRRPSCTKVQSNLQKLAYHAYTYISIYFFVQNGTWPNWIC